MEYEDDIKMNNSELLKICRYYALNQQLRKCIFIFDSDDDQVTKEVSVQGESYKTWGNNVYSLVLPVPTHRLSNPRISIEMYYSDNDIKRTDKNGRRLFLSNEFNPHSGRHNFLDLNCSEPKRIRGDLKIVDDGVFNSQSQNMALSKSNYANYILQGEDNFRDLDTSEFTNVLLLFEKL
jgi:hypothetical protein